MLMKNSRSFGFYITAAIIFIGIGFRFFIYGDATLSIAGNDTLSYVESSQAPLFSSEIMTGRRLLSTNLLYKAFEPKAGYKILVNGSVETTRRGFQPGFDGIVILQLVMSIAGWGLFTFIVSEHIKNPVMKVLGTVIILFFAYTPQMADWDSILMSESLTFSLFALQLALLTHIAFSLYKNPDSKILPQLILWAVIYFWWTFLRDTNLFTSLVTIGMTTALLISIRYRKNKYLYGVLGFVAVIFILGLYTSANSTRSLVQITNIYHDDMLPHPARVAALMEWGMPQPNSKEYRAWFPENAQKNLIKFMMTHPGYVATKLAKDFPGAFTEIKQTYFKAPELSPSRDVLMEVGNALHPENTTPFLASLLLLIGLLLLAVKNVGDTTRPWAWIGLWLFLTASITFIPTILGDTWALNRHALFSTMIYRMCMWLFAIIVMDIALGQNPQPQNQ